MIRIRFPDEANIPSMLLGVPFVQLVSDPRVITLETEKNGPRQFQLVEQFVRPAFQEAWHDSGQLFDVVAIETRAGCNYGCSFCPVSRSADPRPPGEMSEQLLQKIAGELAGLDFAGRLGLFLNNEPMLDGRLPWVVEIFRLACPQSEIRVLTNGSLARLEAVTELFRAGLSTLVINNYTDGARLIRPVRELIGAADRLAAFDIRVSVRKRVETLTTRAGLAPNKPIPSEPAVGFCALPFTDICINYTGGVNLCCFDAHGRVSMGSVAADSLIDIWQSRHFEKYRRSLLGSVRSGLTPCESCDYDGYRRPMFSDDTELVRSDLEVQLEPQFD